MTLNYGWRCQEKHIAGEWLCIAKFMTRKIIFFWIQNGGNKILLECWKDSRKNQYKKDRIYSSTNSLSRIPAATDNEMLLERDSLIEGHRVNAIPDACTHSRTRPTRAIHNTLFVPRFLVVSPNSCTFHKLIILIGCVRGREVSDTSTRAQQKYKWINYNTSLLWPLL